LAPASRLTPATSVRVMVCPPWCQRASNRDKVVPVLAKVLSSASRPRWSNCLDEVVSC
jgi:hypothetical protein